MVLIFQGGQDVNLQTKQNYFKIYPTSGTYNCYIFQLYMDGKIMGTLTVDNLNVNGKLIIQYQVVLIQISINKFNLHLNLIQIDNLI